MTTLVRLLGLALLLPAAQLAAQTQPAAPAQPAPATAPSVTVAGQRGGVGDPYNVIAAKSKVLSRKLASSCNFMSSYSAADEDVMLNYMEDFNMTDSTSNDAERLREFSPEGDVSTMALSTSSSPLVPDTTNPNAPSVGCGKADRAFAAGRNYIERKDKSLGQAFAAFDSQDYPQALALFNTAYTKIGYEEAALMLGKLHLYGLGTPKDTPRAVEWFRKVVDARYDPVADRMSFDPRAPGAMNVRSEACITLAKIYMVGLGTRKDPAEARKWYAKAAEIGFMPANNNLGQAYLSGYGGEKSPAKAMAYFKEAAGVGYAPAQYNLANLYYAGADGVARDLAMAGAYYAVAAKAGHPGAQFAAARMYDRGEGVPVNQARAIALYKDAAVKGNADAQSALATYFHDGEQVGKDLDTARKLFSAAATGGQVDAMFNLGVMLAQGEGGPKDLAMAYVWLSLAKQSGYASADAALKVVAPMLNAQEHAKADAILKPRAGS